MRELKESGTSWIDKIPENWNIVPLKSKFNFGKGLSITKANLVETGHPVISYGQIHSKKCDGVHITNDLIRYVDDTYLDFPQSLVHSGGFIFADTSEDIDGCGNAIYKEDNTELFAGYHTIVLNPNSPENNKYLAYLFRTNVWRQQIREQLTEVKLYSISQKVLKETSILIPPLSEQHAIVAYLDEKCAAIDESIQKRKEIIEKLQEYRKAVITQAVTKGLDPNVSVKDSHVPWLGQIGITCDTYKLKFGTYMKGRIGWQGLKAEDFIDEGPYCVTSTDFTNGKVDWNKSYHVSEERYDMDPFIQLKKGDLLISKDGTIGKLAFIDELPGPACLNSHLLVLRPLTNRFSNEYLYHVLASNVFVQYYELVSTGSTMQSLSQEKLSNFVIPVWDRNTEKAIVQYLNKKCAEIDETLAKQQIIIDKLEEYKKSIIYNAVTGKIDCRPS